MFPKTSFIAEIHVSIFNFNDSLNVLNFWVIWETSTSWEVKTTSNSADIASNIAKIVYQLSGFHFKINDAKIGVKRDANSS